MPTTHPTKTSTRTLSEVAKYLVVPSGIVKTGYPAVAAQCRKMGVIHDDWQQGLGRAVLAKRETGLYAAGIGGVYLSSCRQVGKTFTFGTMIFALCILTRRTKALWTSHHSKTTDETFEALAGLAQRPQIKPFIRKVISGNGKQQIIFTNGSRILFGAREHGFGRGVPGVTIVVFDEAQILKQSALNDMIPAANTVRNPLIIYMGTPPDPKDPAEVFKGARREARAILKARQAGVEVESDELWVEIGADDGADPDDELQRRKGNPSYPRRTPRESILRLRKQLRDDKAFIREGMGVWDSDDDGYRHITAEEWTATEVQSVPDEGLRALGVAFSLDGSRVSVGGALKHETGQHVELIAAHDAITEDGIGPLADWIADRWRTLATVVISGRAGADALALALRERKVPKTVVHIAATPEYLAACSMLPDAIRGRTVTHPAAGDGDVLDASVAISDKKQRGTSGAWGWAATTEDGDETPMEAISLALWGVRTTKRRPGRKQVTL
jgi:hypothetical protein